MTIMSIFLLVNMGKIIGTYNKNLMDSYDEHLRNIADATDKTLTEYLNRCNNGFDYVLTVDNLKNAENEWFQTNDPECFSNILQNNILLKTNLISMIMVSDGSNTICCSHCGTECEYTFLYVSEDKQLGIVLSDENEAYFTIIREHNGLTYSALIDPLFLYERITTTKITDWHWVALYWHDANLVLQNNDLQPNANIFTEDEIENRQDGYTLLLHAEQSGITSTDEYEFTNVDGYHTRYRLYSMATSQTQNKVFALASAMDYNDIVFPYNSPLLMMIISIFSIVTTIFLWIFVAVKIFNRKKAIDKKIEKLEKEKRFIESLNQQIMDLEQHQRLETIGVMSSSIAHEFNNLLTPIMGYSIMSLDLLSDPDTELGNNLEIIYNSSNKAKNLIQRITSYSKKNAVEAKQETNANYILKCTETLAQASAPSGVTLSFSLDNEPPQFSGDNVQLIQMCLNLIINAFQAFKNEPGIVTVCSGHNEEFVSITISDNGPGIDRTILEHMFEPFVTTKENGTGLGLSIAKRIVELHNGTINVNSTPENGTTFTIALPY